MSTDLEQAWSAMAEGNTAAVSELADRALASAPEPELFRWAMLLAEAGLAERAAEVAGRLRTTDLRERALAVLADSEQPVGGATDEGDDDDLRRPPVVDPDEEVVRSFVGFFAGRRDLYARQWYDEKRRRSGYRPVREPVTERVVRDHLAGRITMGQYLLWPDDTVSFGVIDLDVSPSALAELRACRGDDADPLGFEPLRAYAARLVTAGARIGLPLFGEASGGRGMHLWLFLDPRRPARAVRALLGQIAGAAGGPPPDVGVELFPKQDSSGPRGLSSLVKLPLGIHQATLRRCPLLDDDLVPIEEPRSALARLRVVEPAIAEAVLGRRLVPLPAPELEHVEPAPPLPRDSSPRSLAESLRAVPTGPAARRAVEHMLASCAVLSEIVERGYESRHLTPDEARAVAYTVGLVGERNEIADELFAIVRSSFKELARLGRGLPSPMGCSKLRALSPSRCARCPELEAALPYPTPALLAIGSCKPSAARHAPFAAQLEGEPVVDDPLAAIGDSLRRIEDRLGALELGGERHGTGREAARGDGEEQAGGGPADSQGTS